MANLFKYKKTLLLFFFTGVQLLLMAAPADSTLCIKMKWGKFNYSNDLSQTIIVERKRSIQIETNLVTQQITKLKVKWISNCSYEIKQIWSNSKAIRKNNGSWTTVIINKVGPLYYEYSCVCDNATDVKNSKGVMYVTK
jgi:hypothetical protein